MWLWVIGALIVISALGPVIVKVLVVALSLAGIAVLIIIVVVIFESVAWLSQRRPLVLTGYIVRRLGSSQRVGRSPATLTSRPALIDEKRVRVTVTVSLAGSQNWFETLGLVYSWKRALIRGIGCIGQSTKAREALEQALEQCPSEHQHEITPWLGLVLASEGNTADAVRILRS